MDTERLLLHPRELRDQTCIILAVLSAMVVVGSIVVLRPR